MTHLLLLLRSPLDRLTEHNLWRSCVGLLRQAHHFRARFCLFTATIDEDAIGLVQGRSHRRSHRRTAAEVNQLNDVTVTSLGHGYILQCEVMVVELPLVQMRQACTHMTQYAQTLNACSVSTRVCVWLDVA